MLKTAVGGLGQHRKDHGEALGYLGYESLESGQDRRLQASGAFRRSQNRDHREKERLGSELCFVVNGGRVIES